MGIGENDYFFEVSRLRRAITMLDERISAVSSREEQGVESDDEFDEIKKDSGSLNLMKLSRILSEGNVVITSMKAFRGSLVSRLRETYQNFADKEFEGLYELHEDSALGGPAEQCAFAITAILDSFVSQFEEQVDQKNSTVELLLEFSEELGLPDQAMGDQEPLSGLGAVRLSEGIGSPCNGIKAGNDELRIVVEAHAVTEFINQMAAAAIDLISEAVSSESSQIVGSEIFSVSEDREYAYGEVEFPSKEDDARR